MALQESGEMYLESIYVLTGRMNAVRSIDVCEYMGFSKPSVSHEAWKRIFFYCAHTCGNQVGAKL